MTLQKLAAACSLLLALCAPPAPAAEPPLPEVRPIDLATLQSSAFSDDDLDLPYHLFHFHTVANAVESAGPTRGFIHLNVWRRSDNPANARVMENLLSLAWFYCAERSWNPYHGDPALRARLEAALEFWCREQLPNGQFSQTGSATGDLAATAFATKFVGEALLLLRTGPPIDEALRQRAEEADRRALAAVLTDPALYKYGCSYENQFGGIWCGGPTYFQLRPESELRTRWEALFWSSKSDLQSPAGHYYEKRGCDFEYTLDTHNHNSRQAWPYLRGTPLGDELVARDRAWFEWVAYNAPPEPGGGGFIVNHAIETRQRQSSITTFETPLGEAIPLVRAFSESRDEKAARLAHKRAALTAAWPSVPALKLGEMTAFSPYIFLHRRHEDWLPTTAERDAARTLLPVNARDRFTQQRADSQQKVAYTFIRRPAYYAAFNSGKIITPQQRFGLGLLWTPALGAVLQSQTASNTAAWGTVLSAAPAPSEAGGVKAAFLMNAAAQPPPAPGIRELPTGALEIRYPLASGEKSIAFQDDAIEVTVQSPGALAELLPLLVPPDGRLLTAPGRVTLETPRGHFRITFPADTTAEIALTSTTVLKKQLQVVTLHAHDHLTYRLECPAP